MLIQSIMLSFLEACLESFEVLVLMLFGDVQENRSLISDQEVIQ